MAALCRPCFKCCSQAAKDVVVGEIKTVAKDAKSGKLQRDMSKLIGVGSELPTLTNEMLDSHHAWSPDLRITAVDLAHGARAKGVDVGGN